MKRLFSLVASLGLVTLMLGGTAGVVLGHDVSSISGTVDCSGNYSITVIGNVYGTTTLVVKLNGSTISNAVTGQANSDANQSYGPFTGGGATAGEAISAYPSDNSNGAVTGNLVADPEVCGATVTFHKAITSDPAGPADLTDFVMHLDSADNSYQGVNGDTVQVVPGTYTLTEDQLPGYSSADGAGCYNTVTQAGSGSPVTIVAGDAWICGFNNQYTAMATVTFHKAITSDPAGPAALTDFVMHLDNTDNQYQGVNGDIVQVLPGTYTLTEDQLPGYSSADGAGCYNTETQDNSASSVTIAAGDSWVCGFNNQYTPPNVPLFQKVIVGGSATYSDFTFTITQGTDVTTVPGSALDTSGIYWGAPLQGSYIIAETNLPARYSVGYSEGCQQEVGVVTTDSGVGNPECVITDTYVPPTPVPCTLANGCVINTPTPSVTPSPTPIVTPTPVVTPPPPVVTPKPSKSPKVTPPPTDMAGTNSGSSGGPLPLVLTLLGALMVALVLVTPRRSKNLR